MQTLQEFRNHPYFKKIQYIFTDIDDTLTTEGKLKPEAYSSLWDLTSRGYKIIPITGRPAGWCDMIARFWPVDGVIGENGGFYFRYDESTKKMTRHFVFDESQIQHHQTRLKAIAAQVLKEVPQSQVSADQFCRLMDLAIDFAEDVGPLTPTEIQKIVDIFTSFGAQAKVSSIHVNGWFGDYDKLTTCKVFCEKELKFHLEAHQEKVLFIGDSPNDEPMFQFFENSFAVENIQPFLSQIQFKPQYLVPAKGGEGFKQLTDLLISNH